MASKSNILIAAVAGLAVGIGIGMLIAPEKGSKTRKKIGEKIRDLADQMEEKIPGSFEEFKDSIRHGKDKSGKEKHAGEPAQTA